MKILRMFATAGLVVASLGATTAASARDHHNGRGYENARYDRGDHGRDRFGRHDNGRHNGWRNGRGHHNRCHTEWRHHRQIRVCR